MTLKVENTKVGGTIQDGRSLTSRDCSSQGRRRELEDATLSDQFWLLTEQKIPQWRKHTGGQRDSRGQCSGSAGTSARQLLEQSKQVWRTRTGPSRTPEPSAAAVMAPWRCSARCRVNMTDDRFPFGPRFGAPGRQSHLLRTQEGSQTGESWAEKHHQL